MKYEVFVSVEVEAEDNEDALRQVENWMDNANNLMINFDNRQSLVFQIAEIYKIQK